MKIKQIGSSEIDQVAGLFDQYRVFYRQPSDPGLSRQYLQTRLDKKESVVFVAFLEIEGRFIPMGFTQLYPNYSSIRAIKNWTLNDLFVEPGYRNRNIGRALIQTAIDFARQEGAHLLELSTGSDNFIAQGIYEKMGFQQQPPESYFITYAFFLDIQNQKS